MRVITSILAAIFVSGTAAQGKPNTKVYFKGASSLNCGPIPETYFWDTIKAACDETCQWSAPGQDYIGQIQYQGPDKHRFTTFVKFKQEQGESGLVLNFYYANYRDWNEAPLKRHVCSCHLATLTRTNHDRNATGNRAKAQDASPTDFAHKVNAIPYSSIWRWHLSRDSQGPVYYSSHLHCPTLHALVGASCATDASSVLLS